jgi:hypothetical protein
MGRWLLKTQVKTERDMERWQVGKEEVKNGKTARGEGSCKGSCRDSYKGSRKGSHCHGTDLTRCYDSALL